MANQDIVNIKREKVGEIELSPSVFEAEVNRALLHEVVSIARANARTGTRAVKGRSAVAGGGASPGSRRERAGRGWGPFVHPSGAEAVRFSGRSPRITMSACPGRRGRLPCGLP